MDQDRFYRLLDDVESQGGVQAEGACIGVELRYKHIPKLVKTHACQHSMRLDIPYEVESTGTTPVEAYATVCAVGDMVDLWPRFEEA